MKPFYRHLTWIFLLSLSAQIAAYAGSPDCQRELTSAEQRQAFIQDEYARAKKELAGYDNVVLSILGQRLRGRIAAKCEKEGLCSSADISKVVRETLEATTKFSRRGRGYAIVISAMLGSVALSTDVISELPPYFKALAIPVATLTFYVFGSPILEPITSAFRKFAFGVGADSSGSTSAQETTGLESQWFRTQARFSQNAQMSRNVIQQILISAQQSCDAAHRALRTSNDECDRAYAIDQIVELAVRIRTIYPDVDPGDVSVARVIRLGFTGHLEDPERVREAVLARILEEDAAAGDLSVRRYYDQMLQAWFSG